MEPVKLSVRTLVEFVLRCGDIDARAAAGGYDRANEGARIHRKLQKAAGKGYQAEVPLTATRTRCLPPACRRPRFRCRAATRF